MKKVIIYASLSLVVCVFAGLETALAKKIQPVYSFKNLGEFTGPDGSEFTKLKVKCNTDDTPRYILRNTGEEQWCIQGMLESCAKERIDSATVACTTSASVLAATEKTPAPSVDTAALERKKAEREKLLAEQMAVEKQRLEIEARRVQLREKELRLSAAEPQN